MIEARPNRATKIGLGMNANIQFRLLSCKPGTFAKTTGEKKHTYFSRAVRLAEGSLKLLVLEMTPCSSDKKSRAE